MNAHPISLGLALSCVEDLKMMLVRNGLMLESVVLIPNTFVTIVYMTIRNKLVIVNWCFWHCGKVWRLSNEAVYGCAICEGA